MASIYSVDSMNNDKLISMRFESKMLDDIDYLVANSYFQNRSKVIRRLLLFVLTKGSKEELLDILRYRNPKEIPFVIRERDPLKPPTP